MTRKLTKSRRLLYGVGINDADYTCSTGVGVNGKWKVTWSCPYMVTWKSMLARCYSAVHQKTHPTYIGCTVCEEWLTFSNFKAWMEKQDWKGRHLDKDLLTKGNRVYSPDTCIFVPNDVNQLVSHKKKGVLPLGIQYEKDRGLYRALCKVGGIRKFKGRRDNALDAHLLWVVGKMEQVEFLRNKYSSDNNVQRALNRVEAMLDYHLLNKIELKEM